MAPPAKTTASFCADARKVHGKTYDYSRVNYVNAHTKVTIICRKHGPYEQSPNSHLSGSGCKVCGEESSKARQRKDTKTFIADARKVHGRIYDYSRSAYEGAFAKLSIVCRKHGEFLQSANSHLRGAGCPECGRAAQGAKMTLQRTMSTKEVVSRARARFGDRFSYRRTVYKDLRTPLVVTCRDHGDFSILVGALLRGKMSAKCPTCLRAESTFRMVRKTHKVNMPDGSVRAVQGYERFAVPYLLAERSNRQLYFTKDVPIVPYTYKGNRRYFPDMRYSNTLVEVKAEYTWHKERERNKAKLKACLDAGFKVRLLVFSNNGKLVADELVHPSGRVIHARYKE